MVLTEELIKKKVTVIPPLLILVKQLTVVLEKDKFKFYRYYSISVNYFMYELNLYSYKYREIQTHTYHTFIVYYTFIVIVYTVSTF